MRWRITIRSTGRVELRGFVDGPWEDVVALADAVKPLGYFVMASPAGRSHDPFDAHEESHPSAIMDPGSRPLRADSPPAGVSAAAALPRVHPSQEDPC